MARRSADNWTAREQSSNILLNLLGCPIQRVSPEAVLTLCLLLLLLLSLRSDYMSLNYACLPL